MNVTPYATGGTGRPSGARTIAATPPPDRESPFTEADRDMRERAERLETTLSGRDFVERVRSL